MPQKEGDTDHTENRLEGVKKTRYRSKAQRRRAIERRDEGKVLDLHYLFHSLSEEAQQVIEFNHLPVPEYGDISQYNKSVNQRIVTVGNNPAPAKSEQKNTTLTGPHAGCVTAALVYSGSEQVPLDIQEVILDCGHDYFLMDEQPKQKNRIGHSYFNAYIKIGRGMAACYYKASVDICNFMLHIDLFPFSTKLRWGLLPIHIQEEFLDKSGLLERLQSLKPTIVIIGVELLKVIHLLPGLRWAELKRTLKTKTIVQVNWAVEHVKHIGKVLFIQTTPSPFPFLRFSDDDKEEIGHIILDLATNHRIGIKK